MGVSPYLIKHWILVEEGRNYKENDKYREKYLEPTKKF